MYLREKELVRFPAIGNTKEFGYIYIYAYIKEEFETNKNQRVMRNTYPKFTLIDRDTNPVSFTISKSTMGIKNQEEIQEGVQHIKASDLGVEYFYIMPVIPMSSSNMTIFGLPVGNIDERGVMNKIKEGGMGGISDPEDILSLYNSCIILTPETLQYNFGQWIPVKMKELHTEGVMCYIGW